MNTVLACAASLMLLFPALSTLGAPAPEPRRSAGQAELLVKLRRDPPVKDPAAVHASVGATLIRSYHAVGWDLVRLPESMSASEGLARYHAHPDVLAAEANRQIHLQPPAPPPSSPEVSKPTFRATAVPGTVTPNDPRWPNQWNLRKISMPAAWAVTTGSSNVVVAVMDTGVDYTHEDLSENMWRNPGEIGLDAAGNDRSSNGLDDDANGYIDDVFGIDPVDDDADPMDEGYLFPGDAAPSYHGTATAGVIAARGNNQVGISGVSWWTQIMALRIYQAHEFAVPWRTFQANVVEAFDYVIEQRRRGINIRLVSNSWAETVKSEAIRDAIERAGREGILTVCVTGNFTVSNDLEWFMPSTLDSAYVLAVGGTDQNDLISNLSNFGRSTIDLAAPGVNIPATSTNGAYYPMWGGTSAATPQVVGAAALLLAVRPEAAPLELKAALMHSVDQPASLRGRLVSNGRLNVARALEVVTNAALPPVIVGAFPASSQTKTNAVIELWFSRPMDRTSVESALRFTPQIAGTMEWADGNRVLRLRPNVPLIRTNYTARVLGSARDLEGRSIDGDFDCESEGSPADDFLWEFRFAPEHDDFANAVLLSGAEGSRQDNTSGTSSEFNEPLLNENNRYDGVFSLWYKWVANNNGWITFDSSLPAGVNTVIAAYRGSTLDSLVELAFNDDYGARRGGRISLPVSADATYYITVGGKWWDVPFRDTVGTFTLSWYPTPSPSFRGTTPFNPGVAAAGANITLFGTNFSGATEVLFNGARAQFTPGLTNNSDVRITAIVPPDAIDGPITIRTPHGDVTSAASFVVGIPPVNVTQDVERNPEIHWAATSPAIILESTDDLASGPWTVITTPLTRTNSKTFYRPPEKGAKRFYRLRKAPVQ